MLVLLGFCLTHQGHNKTKKDSRSDSTGRRSRAADEGPQKALLCHRLLNPLGEGIAETGKGDCGPGSSPIHQGLVDAKAAQNDPGCDIADQNFGGSELGFVNE